MKLEITEKGVHGEDGKELEVGSEVTVKGNEVPGWLVGKSKPIDKTVAVVNPGSDDGEPVVKDPVKTDSKKS